MNEILRDSQTQIEHNDAIINGYGVLQSKIAQINREIAKQKRMYEETNKKFGLDEKQLKMLHEREDIDRNIIDLEEEIKGSEEIVV